LLSSSHARTRKRRIGLFLSCNFSSRPVFKFSFWENYSETQESIHKASFLHVWTFIYLIRLNYYIKWSKLKKIIIHVNSFISSQCYIFSGTTDYNYVHWKNLGMAAGSRQQRWEKNRVCWWQASVASRLACPWSFEQL